MFETYLQRNVLLSELGFTDYGEYLCSDLWSDIRTRAQVLHGDVCKICKGRADVFHHVSYKREVLVGENLTELVPLCHGCHYKVEFDHQDKKRCLQAARRTYRRLVNPKKVKVGVKKKKTKRERPKCPVCNNPIGKNRYGYKPCKVCLRNQKVAE